MKTISLFPLRMVFVAVTLFATSVGSYAETPAVSDPAMERLVASGAIPVKAAGAHVELGTLRIQVSTKLGRPSAVLSDGTWLYENRSVKDSTAQGTLVVRFNQGRVSGLALVNPAGAMAI